jgi:hypothetical protein
MAHFVDLRKCYVQTVFTFWLALVYGIVTYFGFSPLLIASLKAVVSPIWSAFGKDPSMGQYSLHCSLYSRWFPQGLGPILPLPVSIPFFFMLGLLYSELN